MQASGFLHKKPDFFRFNESKLILSYADCIGYITAQIHNMKFLTGDKHFKGMKDVEFVR